MNNRLPSANLVNETNNLFDVMDNDEAKRYRAAPTVSITDPRVRRVIRLRYLSEPGFPAWDLSYCWGEYMETDADGIATVVPCRLRADWLYQVPKTKVVNGRHVRVPLKAALYDLFKANGLHAKNLGVFDALSTLN